MEVTIKSFTCRKNELERINEGLQKRNVDVNDVISITDNGSSVTIFYRYRD